jgi:hypothetical protein
MWRWISLVLLLGCGGTEWQAAMDASRAVCTAKEWEIVHREGTTMEQDKRDLATVRDICDGIYAGLEALYAEMVSDGP